MTSFAVTAIGKVESPLTQPESAPRQPDEGAPAAWLVFEPEVLEGPAEPRVMAKAAFFPTPSETRRHRREQQHRPEELGPRELHAEVIGEAEAGGRLALHAANRDGIY